MRYSRMTYYIAFLFTLLVCINTSCTLVHEFPEPPATQPLYVQLHYDTAWTLWEQPMPTRAAMPQVQPLTDGDVQYVLRAYPVVGGQIVNQAVQERILHGTIQQGYDTLLRMDLPAGEYQVMVWTDLSRNATHAFYDYQNFASICLAGELHVGNTDYRDAFRGVQHAMIITDILERQADTIRVQMERPLAKYEFITTDLQEFADKELHRIAGEASGSESSSDSESSTTTGSSSSSQLNMSDYKVEFRYVGYMPSVYNMFTDKPVDAETGVLFASTMSRLSDTEASLGFDYVFVNGEATSVAVQIALYNMQDALISLSSPVEVPLKRSHHTVVRGAFLTASVDGGITIDPSYDGDHNIILP